MYLKKRGTWESDRVMVGMNNWRVESLKDKKQQVDTKGFISTPILC
jgi:hypothetical protein